MVLYGRNHTLTETVRRGVRAGLDEINTCLPGIVREFDPLTRRAKVQPAIQVEFVGEGYRDHPIIVDVPVLSSAGNGYILAFTVVAGDPVQLVFSQRGMDNFKRQYANSTPSRVGYFSLQDAVAYAGFGPRTITPGVPMGMAMQDTGGSRYVGVNAGGVVVGGGLTIDGGLTVASGGLVVAGGATINGGLTVDGRSI